jgi:diacylglycerol kinase family enzyme
VVGSDAELRRLVEQARRVGTDLGPVGLTGGSLWRTVGGAAAAGRLRTPDAWQLPVDVGAVLLDGRLFWFTAHLVARNRVWTRAFVACNAQFVGPYQLAPRAHPGDGLLDCYEAQVTVADVVRIVRRARAGAHLPHPGLRERRVPAYQVELPRPLPVWLDGERVGRFRHISVRLEPDALTVVV